MPGLPHPCSELPARRGLCRYKKWALSLVLMTLVITATHGCAGGRCRGMGLGGLL